MAGAGCRVAQFLLFWAGGCLQEKPCSSFLLSNQKCWTGLVWLWKLSGT